MSKSLYVFKDDSGITYQIAIDTATSQAHIFDYVEGDWVHRELSLGLEDARIYYRSYRQRFGEPVAYNLNDNDNISELQVLWTLMGDLEDVLDHI